MMHGTINTNQQGSEEQRTIITITRDFLWDRRRWLAIVVLPTLLVSAYLWLIASRQYVSEAHFLVRSTQNPSSPPSGLGQALSLMGGVSTTQSDAASVSDYLSSHDAVDKLRQDENLVDVYSRSDADFFSKLRPFDPSPERLFDYFRAHTDIKLNSETGITSIKVRTFRPKDSFRIVNALMRMGEERVNILNQRAYDNSIVLARKQLADAEAAVRNTQTALTSFRQNRQNIDPVATGQAQIGVVSSLRNALAQSRAQRASLGRSVSSNSPQAIALDARVRALESQVASEASRLTGGRRAIAGDVGDYQELQLRQQFAAKRYDDAAASLQRARQLAEKQQLFIVRVVEPNMPVKALYPEKLKIAATVFFTLLLCYAIGWLIMAGVKEHAA